MSKISILSEILINKIAAGEVIERPASVVRELIDNSIDAGATQINIEVLYSGKKLIRVSDNGSGMDRNDALLCLDRHATSKIRSEDDLFGISTLGFRGEALPATASISKITLTTAAGPDAGVRIDIGANRKKEITDAPPSKGTTVEVRDIFYNTPARRKFLKSDPTELSHIVETVIQKALAYPEISFSLTHNNSELLNAPVTSSSRERFIQLYGEEFSNEFPDVKKEGSGIKICGFVSSPDFARAGRSHQHIFINKRPVKNPTVSHAIYSAYGNLIPKDKHPAFFLFLEIDPAKVDINVHPAKREVKFENSSEVHRFAEAAVREALVPPGRNYSPDQGADYRPPQYDGYQARHNAAVSESPAGMFTASQTGFFTSAVTQDMQLFFHIGESFFATITNSGLLIIDQHAAHERILYEKLIGKTTIEAEPLFLPMRIELPLKEYLLVVRYKNVLHELGLEAEDFGGNSIIIRSLPEELTKADMKGLLMDISEVILEEETGGIKGDVAGSLLKNIAARLACHKSVRGSARLSREEMARMMADLDRTAEPGRCPHGRPTKILLSLDDLKKMFKRK